MYKSIELKTLIISLVLFIASNFAQVETISSDNHVYIFLEEMYNKGILTDYDGIILPLPRQRIIYYLEKIKAQESLLSEIDKLLLQKFLIKIVPVSSSLLSPQFPKNLFADTKKSLYYFNDENIHFTFSPLFDISHIKDLDNSQSAILFNLGGLVYGSYQDFFGFSVGAFNGFVKGDRNVSLYDERVAGSFSFNKTKNNFFDNTLGHFRLQKGILGLQVGRERLLIGRGKINRLILSDSPSIFDFIKFDIAYKSLSYNFIHGWLVQPPDTIISDLYLGQVKSKKSKYLALSRLGCNPTNDFGIGISQLIIYGNRPVELAYLSPFVFYESAQRSLGDLDNSFLIFDSRYLITNGIEINASVLFDDIDFGLWFSKDWTKVDNRFAWQAGLFLTDAVLPKGLSAAFEYVQIRPYTFSHIGFDEDLTYTSNGRLLGIDQQPNSVSLSYLLRYRLFYNLSLEIKYINIKHGENIYDEDGVLLKNYGGNILFYPTLYDQQFVNLLEGNRTVSNYLRFTFEYEFLYGFYLNFKYQYKNEDNLNMQHAFISSLFIHLD